MAIDIGFVLYIATVSYILYCMFTCSTKKRHPFQQMNYNLRSSNKKKAVLFQEPNRESNQEPNRESNQEPNREKDEEEDEDPVTPIRKCPYNLRCRVSITIVEEDFDEVKHELVYTSNENLDVNIDFDGASQAWRANKKQHANNHFSYICGAPTKGGKRCEKKPCNNLERCHLHKKCSL